MYAASGHTWPPHDPTVLPRFMRVLTGKLVGCRPVDDLPSRAKPHLDRYPCRGDESRIGRDYFAGGRRLPIASRPVAGNYRVSNQDDALASGGNRLRMF
jgi:hypothetical protein